MPSALSPADALRDALMAARNPDGGWGYFAAKSSRLEPTCWAFLALASGGTTGASPAAVQNARSWLLRCQRPDGLLVDAATASLNLAFNGLAAIALMSDTETGGRAAAVNVLHGLVEHRGAQTPQVEYFRQNNQLQGWAWADNTFSWVEPTAWCLLALKKATRLGDLGSGAERIAEAEKMLIDRTCRSGGWNYGNANVLGKALWAYVPTTALGLLAMQDRRDHPAIARSVDYLRANQLSESSGMALGLSAICFSVLGEADGALAEQLRRQAGRIVDFGNSHVHALSLFALTVPEHGARAIKL